MSEEKSKLMKKKKPKKKLYNASIYGPTPCSSLESQRKKEEAPIISLNPLDLPAASCTGRPRLRTQTNLNLSARRPLHRKMSSRWSGWIFKTPLCGGRTLHSWDLHRNVHRTDLEGFRPNQFLSLDLGWKSGSPFSVSLTRPFLSGFYPLCW